MQFVLDTADIEAVKDLDGMLTVSGVTTNPTIITKSGKTPEQVADDMLSYLAPEQMFFMQAISTDVDGILSEARTICGLRKNNYVKIPVTHAGLRAIKAAKAEGLNVLATAIYSADSAFMAALNGADYLAPYVNRMCNYGDGVSQVVDLLDMIAAANLPAKVMAASFKNVDQVHALMAAGIQAVTVQPPVVYQMIDHPGTQIAVDEFTDAWEKAFGRRTLLA